MRYYLVVNYGTAVSHRYCVRCGRSLGAVVSAEPIRYHTNNGRAVYRAYLICSAIRVKSFLWGLRAVVQQAQRAQAGG
jgi:hypothetical protein